ncbi:MAG: tetratricopeptide repeat protein [Burkholderiales bacterium]|nr:tetratricopeptide repeat protein [Burkholderiales bacterium]
MSVINQMLIDLERRRASGEERNRIPDHVRALPGAPLPAVDWRAPPLLAAVALGVLLLATGAAWWWRDALPWWPSGLKQTLVTLPPADESGNITRRMSLELAQLPADTAGEGLSAQSIIVTQPPEWAEPRGGVPKAAAVEPAPASAMVATATVTASAKPPVEAPSAKAEKSQASMTAPAQINRREREQTPRQRAESEYARGAAALHQGRHAEARAAFEEALQIEPALHSARQALVGLMVDARQPAEAVRLLQDGLQLAPSQPGFAMMLARLQVERGELDAGVQTLARSLEYAASNADYAAFYAGLLQRQQRHAQAVEMFDRALRLRPGNGVWLLGMGLSLEALGRGNEAQEAFRRARASGNLPADLQNYADQRIR